MRNRLETWQKKSAWPLVFLSLVYIAVYVYPIFAYPTSSLIRRSCEVVGYAIWGVFVLDYAIQLYLAPAKKAFLRREWFHLLVVLLPFFRPIRAIRAIILSRQAATNPKDATLLSIPWVISVLGLLMMVVMAAAELNVERLALGSNIHTTSDALWWALVTMTTIGYGDKYPVTTEGRLIAGVLILFGIGLVASLTGYFASWVLRQSQAVGSRASAGPNSTEI